MSSPPWRQKTESLFHEKKKTQGNYSDSAHIYRSARWRAVRKRAISEQPFQCSAGNCILLAKILDHIIPIREGGAIWDRRNHQKLCDIHHNRKRGKETHGIIEEWVMARTGKIPKRNAHLPEDIAGESYLIK